MPAGAGVINVKCTWERARARKRARFVDDNNILWVVENSVKTTPWANKCARLNHFWLHSQLLHKYEWHGCRLFAYRKDATTTTAYMLRQLTISIIIIAKVLSIFNRFGRRHHLCRRFNLACTSKLTRIRAKYGMEMVGVQFDASSILFFLYIENTVRPIRHKIILWY